MILSWTALEPWLNFETFKGPVMTRSPSSSSSHNQRLVVKFGGSERVRNKSTGKKSRIQLGFEPKTFWILVRHSYHQATWTPGRGAEDKLHKQPNSSWFSLSQSWTELEPWLNFANFKGPVMTPSPLSSPSSHNQRLVVKFRDLMFIYCKWQ